MANSGLSTDRLGGCCRGLSAIPTGCSKPWPVKAVSGYLALGVVGLVACAHREVADPKVFVAEYRAAVERNDVRSVYGMLTRADRERLGIAGVRERLALGGQEIRDAARALATPGAVARVELAYTMPHGTPLTVVGERGRYRVELAGALPAYPLSPRQALRLLRDCLERRDYGALLRLLSATSAATLEGQLSDLAKGLEYADRLDVRVDGSQAAVIVPGGHRVQLRREGEVWKIEDFE